MDKAKVKVILKKAGQDSAVKEIPQDAGIKPVKKLVGPGLFGGITSADIAALASESEKVVIYYNKKPKLSKELFNFTLQKDPLLSIYGTAVVLRVKNSSSEIIEAADVTDDDVKAFEKIVNAK